MAQSYLIFDFGGNEEAAQQARHKVDNWRQAFRLDQKLLLRFDRGDAAQPAATEQQTPVAADPKGKAGAAAAKGSAVAKGSSAKGASTKGDSSKPAEAAESADAPKPADRIQVIVRVDFSDHEKLSHQRWLDRIRGEEPFKSASPQTVRPGDAAHAPTAERFDALAVAEPRPLK